MTNKRYYIIPEVECFNIDVEDLLGDSEIEIGPDEGDQQLSKRNNNAFFGGFTDDEDTMEE